jgi:hypothetical protein
MVTNCWRMQKARIKQATRVLGFHHCFKFNDYSSHLAVFPRGKTALKHALKSFNKANGFEHKLNRKLERF